MKLEPINPVAAIVAAAQNLAKRRACSGVDVRPSGVRQRNHKKRHGENRERSREDRAKAHHARATQNKNLVTRRHIADVMRRYFAGEIPDLSELNRYG